MAELLVGYLEPITGVVGRFVSEWALIAGLVGGLLVGFAVVGYLVSAVKGRL